METMAGRAKSELAPRVEGSAEVYGAQARNRLRAVVDVAIEMVTTGKERTATGRDVYQVMAQAILEDPIGAFVALDKLLPGGDKEQQGKGAALHIGTLYLQAVQQAQPLAQVVDVTPEAGGYIEGTAIAMPLISQEEW